MNTQRPVGIDRSVAQLLMRLFDRMYKLGVNDASRVDDEGLSYMWIEKTSQPGVFGRLGDETSHDPLYWQLTLQKVALELKSVPRFINYARDAGRYGRNYLSVAWVVAQCFYNQGLKDWYDHPDTSQLVSFNNKSRMRWGETLSNWAPSAMVSAAQEFCFERKASDEAEGGKFAIKERHYMTFIKCISLATVINRDYFT